MNNKSLSKITLADKNLIYLIDFSQIIFYASESCYSTLHLIDGRSFVLIKSLSKVEKELNTCSFIRVNQSYLINRNQIIHIDKKNKQVALINSISLPFTITVKKFIELLNLNDLY
ncbi:MAG: hypothetical protein EOP34_06900 [Rickettsiales bacterium]|nr:MAG: hypothetical protein EOP34_06900 [Rickettsiales bacterium]